MINNAGILPDKAFHNTTPEVLEPVLDVHLRGAFHLTRPAWVRMREARYGRVLLTASNAGILGNFGQSNYGHRRDQPGVELAGERAEHEDCPVSGEVYSAAGGRVARFFVGLTEGVLDPKLTVETVPAGPTPRLSGRAGLSRGRSPAAARTARRPPAGTR